MSNGLNDPVEPELLRLDKLPKYLQDAFTGVGMDGVATDADVGAVGVRVRMMDLVDIAGLSVWNHRYAHLLLRRHVLTTRLAALGLLHPPLILLRSYTYEALGYSDLALADAYMVYILCESVAEDDFDSDFVPQGLNGESWGHVIDRTANLRLLVDALVVICRCLDHLGASRGALEYRDILRRKVDERDGDGDGDVGDDENHLPHQTADSKVVDLLRTQPFRLYPVHEEQGQGGPDASYGTVPQPARFGMSRREIYPWNEHEPDRNSPESIKEINSILIRNGHASDLEAKVTALPALDDSSGQEPWYQLGLFAAKDLSPSTTVLREKSMLTAIRPLDDALCDACGADLESVSRDDLRQCPGVNCDITFCSDDCAQRAASEYHRADLGENASEKDDNEDENENEDDDEDDIALDYPPRHAPFCGNQQLNEVGRTSSTETPEWDLYFLLLTRTIQMATTQNIHPLDLPSIKYLWGDFSSPNTIPQPSTTTSTSTSTAKSMTTTTTAATTTSLPSSTATVTDKLRSPAKPHPSLPFSMYHHILLPLQFFEILMWSAPQTHKPYTHRWLADFDFWILQTLFAKFRGVANAQQSTFDGKAEIAAVHPLWCLANHSCQPNVEWTPTGVREFRVRSGDGDGSQDSQSQMGIKMGDQIWSHYTDVTLDVAERRDRLREVLGGICQCRRCLIESGEEK